MSPPFSIATLTLGQLPCLEAIDATADAGFTRMGLRVQPLIGGDDDLPGDAGLQRAVAERMAQRGVTLVDADAVRISEDFAADRIRPALDLATELGAAAMLVFVTDPDEARARDRFLALCEAAAGAGVRLALEFIPYLPSVRSLGTALEWVAASRGAAGICLDALHVFRSGCSVEDLASVPPQRIALVQLCDAGARPPTLAGLQQEGLAGRQLPGEGVLPLRAFLAALPPGVPMSVEAPCARLLGLSTTEKARLVRRSTERFLAGA